MVYVLFFKHVDGVITKEELSEMKGRYTEWSLAEWSREMIDREDVRLVPVKEEGALDSCDRRIRVSEPLFTKDMRKALVKVSKGDKRSGDHLLVVLRKEDGEWQIKGTVPLGIWHGSYH